MIIKDSAQTFLKNHQIQFVVDKIQTIGQIISEVNRDPEEDIDEQQWWVRMQIKGANSLVEFNVKTLKSESLSIEQVLKAFASKLEPMHLGAEDWIKKNGLACDKDARNGAIYLAAGSGSNKERTELFKSFKDSQRIFEKINSNSKAHHMVSRANLMACDLFYGVDLESCTLCDNTITAAPAEVSKTAHHAVRFEEDCGL